VNSELLQGFYLADFHVDPTEGQVIGRDGSVHLPPKAMEVLLCLASNPGELVTRKTLVDTVWGEGQGSRETLTQAISEIRHALDDHHDHPLYVQTLPRRGYRLLVGVELAAGESHSVIRGERGPVTVAQTGLFENLKQRGVLETGAAYLVVGWLLMQIVDIIFSQLHLPAWAGTFVTLLVIAGFPIAVLLSWFLEFRDGRAVPHELSPRDAFKRRFSRTYLSVIGALAIAAVFVYLYDRGVGLPQERIPEVVSLEAASGLPPIQNNSIAILPFLNLDGSEETQTFANGLVEDVITQLSRVPDLLVASRGDSFSLGPNSASTKVRERLRVARYVEGSVQISGDTMRVVVQLIDSATGFHALSRRFDRPVADFFEMRDEITALTVANVRVALPPETRSTRDVPSADTNLDVYRLYRRGIDASRLESTEESLGTALAWFDAALEIDPEYAAAHAGKCAVSVAAYPITDDPAYIDAAELSCARALNLNPNLDVVYTALGELYTVTGRYDAAEEAYLKALSIDPVSTISLIGLGEVYRGQQRPAEAEASIRNAAGLRPGDWKAYKALGMFLFRSGRFVEAAEQFRNVVAVDDSNVMGYTNLGSALMLAGSFAAAEPAYQRAMDLEPQAMTYSNLGLLLYYRGRFDDAVEALRYAVEHEQQDYLVRSNLGDALWGAGNRSAAIDEFGLAEELALGALQVNPNRGLTLLDLAWIYTSLGKHDQVQALIERARTLVPEDPYMHYIEGLILNKKGDTTTALTALKTAINLGYPKKLLAADPNLADLRQNSRFDLMVAPSN
jgi:TolB-like protein/tetratricopeptide (TPR) repeat protein/DNA-binding winged helix-turn-helix (wHTH) protein